MSIGYKVGSIGYIVRSIGNIVGSIGWWVAAAVAGANNNQIEAAFTVLRGITHHLHTALTAPQTAQLEQLT